MSYAFISYSHKDSQYAHKLATEMTRRGIEVWIDDRIDYGEQWPCVIQENLEACQAVVIIMTTNAFNSSWVQSELAFAQYRKKALFPLLLEGNLWVSLASTQHADIRGGKLPPESFFNTIKKHVGYGIPSPTPKAETPVSQKTEAETVLEYMEKQRLGDKLSALFLSAVRNNKEQKWSIGLFTVKYEFELRQPFVLSLRSSALTGVAARPRIEVSHAQLSGRVNNESLLRQYDPKVYEEYMAGLETIRKQLLSSKTVSSAPIDPNKQAKLSNALLGRLNLVFFEFYFAQPTELQIDQSVAKLIEIHMSHNIPISEIKIEAR